MNAPRTPGDGSGLDVVVVPGLPELPLRWLGSPGEAVATRDGVSIVAGPRTDWFVDPRRLAASTERARFGRPDSGDFLLSARVTVGFGATFDAGALVVYGDERCWAKLCFEVSPRESRWSFRS